MASAKYRALRIGLSLKMVTFKLRYVFVTGCAAWFISREILVRFRVRTCYWRGWLICVKPDSLLLAMLTIAVLCGEWIVSVFLYIS